MVSIVGGGPAGAAAALAALGAGARVRLYEQSRFPRHKVCGEFLSPGCADLLDRLGVWAQVERAGAPAIRHAELHFPSRSKRWRLPERAYGLSRHRLDELLLREAVNRGAALECRRAREAPAPCVIAHGRQAAAARGARLFGFKAHFRGPAGDAVELYFQAGCYVGINPVEEGWTNVCGLAPEPLLAASGFEVESLWAALPGLRERLRPLERAMDWLVTGPLVFGTHQAMPAEGMYPAGDALGFVDPFTGTGILAALSTGSLAGRAAASGAPVAEYLAQCRRMLGWQYRAASWLRRCLETGWAERLMAYVPGPALFHLTRPGAPQ